MHLAAYVLIAPINSGASDSDFHYPAGYRICRIVKENPAGYHYIRFLITLINKPFSVLPKIIARMRNCKSYTVETVIGYYTRINAELSLDYTGDVILFQTAFVLNLLSQWLDVISDKVYN